MHHRLACVAAAFVATMAAVASAGFAQDSRAEQIHLVPSKSLGESRQVWVSLPADYAYARRAYPLVIVLDGQDRRLRDLVAASVRFDGRLDFFDPEIPQQIVVGIASGDRGKDFGTRSDAMRTFVLGEVGAFLRSRYRLSGLSVIVGHSLSALFAMKATCAAPPGLYGIIALSPALADSTDLLDVQRCLRSWTDGRDAESRALFIATGTRSNDRTEEDFGPQVQALQQWLRSSGGRTLRWRSVEIPGASHTRTPLRGIPEGVAFLFDPAVWEVPDSLKRSVIQGRADPMAVIDAHVTRLSALLGAPLSPPASWFKVAVALDTKGQRAASRAAIDRGLGMYPEDLDFLLLSASNHAAAGDTVSARRDLRAAEDRLGAMPLIDSERRATWQAAIAEQVKAIRRRP